VRCIVKMVERCECVEKMLGKNNTKISIIVPVYNSEEYLEQCLDSLVNQSYENIEIICLNDGSKDNSLDILYSYASNDSRVVIIDKANSGVSDTRNLGIYKATGEYIMFVDSDDWLELDTCQNAIESIVLSDADIVMWSYVSEGTNKSTSKEIFPEDLCFEDKKIQEMLHRRFVGLIGKELAHPELADSICPVWGKLYNRKLISENKVLFVDLDNIGTYEDGLFNLELFKYARKVVYLNKCYYHYRRQDRNSVTSGYHEKLYEQWQNLFYLIEKYIQENNLKGVYSEALENRIALSTVGLTLNIVRSRFSGIKKVRMISVFLKKERYQKAYSNLCLNYFPVYWKIFYLFAKHHFALGVYLLGVVIQKIISR